MMKGATYPMSTMDGIDVPSDSASRQEAFWTWTHNGLRQCLKDMLELVLKSQQQNLIGAGSNERSAGRTAWRNGYYDRRLTTPQGLLNVRVPRCRSGGIDC
jgi:transposase-like protein